jgi:hypothetical protein
MGLLSPIFHTQERFFMAKMTPNQAIDRVLGKSLADNIRNSQGDHWALIAAMTECKVSHGADVKSALNDGLDGLKTSNANAMRANVQNAEH